MACLPKGAILFLEQRIHLRIDRVPDFAEGETKLLSKATRVHGIFPNPIICYVLRLFFFKYDPETLGQARE